MMTGTAGAGRGTTARCDRPPIHRRPAGPGPSRRAGADDIGKETHWAADDPDKARVLQKHGKGAKADITRFKGLGEMMPTVLWDTTLNPKTRRLLRVTIEDALQTDRVISELMGKDPEPRFHFIMEHAPEAEALDV